MSCRRVEVEVRMWNMAVVKGSVLSGKLLIAL